MATRRGRAWGYAAAVVVGLGIGGFLGYLAFLESMCSLWGGECTAEQTARIGRLWKAALLAPVAVLWIYTLVDFAVISRWGGSED